MLEVIFTLAFCSFALALFILVFLLFVHYLSIKVKAGEECKCIFSKKKKKRTSANEQKGSAKITSQMKSKFQHFNFFHASNGQQCIELLGFL